AEDFLVRLRKFVERAFKTNSRLASVIEKTAFHDHAISTSMIATLLARGLNIESETTFRQIGIAAFLHDVGLYELPVELQVEEPGPQQAWTEEQWSLFNAHPVKSALILKDAFPDLTES